MKDKKQKANIMKNNVLNIDYRHLEKKDYIEKEINKDGNCFYRSLSYYYRQTENDYDEYRQLIVAYIENNLDEYLVYVAEEDLNDPNIDNYSEETITNKKKEYILNYTKNAKKDKEWAGYLEISTAGILFNANIRLYTLNNNQYILYNEFTQEYSNNNLIDCINLLFVNNNHFNLLIKKEYEDIFKVSDNIKNLDFKEFTSILTKANKNRKDLIKSLNIEKINKPNYVKYNRDSCLYYYDEIEAYIKTKTIPNRLQNKPNLKRKTQSKRRGKFRKMVENNYRLEANRLQYKYIYKKENRWLNIPFENEVEALLNYIHYNNNHLKKDRMAIKVINSGFFWFGFTADINNCIIKCGKCHCENKIEKIEKKPKIIITKGPHIRYQADLWYLPKVLKKNNLKH